jgi:hypothetical protein
MTKGYVAALTLTAGALGLGGCQPGERLWDAGEQLVATDKTVGLGAVVATPELESTGIGGIVALQVVKEGYPDNGQLRFFVINPESAQLVQSAAGGFNTPLISNPTVVNFQPVNDSTAMSATLRVVFGSNAEQYALGALPGGVYTFYQSTNMITGGINTEPKITMRNLGPASLGAAKQFAEKAR